MLVHGLTATRRYVVHGSGILERAGYRVVSYDARGHGDSDPSPDPAAYRYADLVGDLATVLDTLGIEQAILVGVSMGAATIVAFALDHPRRASALVLVTPAYGGPGHDGGERLHRSRRLADALEHGGPEGFLCAYGDPPVEPRFKRLMLRAIRERLEGHRHPQAVAAALRAVTPSMPFDIRSLGRLDVPALIVASHDRVDPDHPYELARTYARRMPQAEPICEQPGAPPLAWRGAPLSRAILAFLAARDLGPRVR